MTAEGRIERDWHGEDSVEPGRRLIRLGDKGLSLSERLSTHWRHFVWRTPLHRLRLRGKFPLKLLAIPDDPLPGDPARGRALLEGRASWRGEEIAIERLDFADLQVSPGFSDYLQSFAWLRDLAAAADRHQGSPVAEELTRKWLDGQSEKVSEAGWRADIWGLRVMMWAAHAPLILSSADLVYRSAVLNAIARGARHLDRSADKAPLGVRRVAAWAGVIAAGLVVQGEESRVARGETGLARALAQTLSADGGMICRSPAAQLALVETLAMLGAVYEARRRDPPASFGKALAYAVPALVGVTLGDGGLSSWQGALPIAAARVASAIRATGHPERPLNEARDWGYQRMAAGPVIVIVDAAPPPGTRIETGGCASTLALEMSDGPHRLIVNCGGSSSGLLPKGFSDGLRTTAAHSTLIVSDSNSTALHADGALGKGVIEVELARLERGGVARLEASHDGYARRYGFVHRRQLGLAGDGSELRGEDVLLPIGRRRPDPTRFALRFHLGQGVDAAPTADGAGALLRIARGPSWHFRCQGAGCEIDDSVWVDSRGRPLATRQLVLAGEAAPGGASVSWLFRRAG